MTTIYLIKLVAYILTLIAAVILIVDTISILSSTWRRVKRFNGGSQSAIKNTRIIMIALSIAFLTINYLIFKTL